MKLAPPRVEHSIGSISVYPVPPTFGQLENPVSSEYLFVFWQAEVSSQKDHGQRFVAEEGTFSCTMRVPYKKLKVFH